MILDREYPQFSGDDLHQKKPRHGLYLRQTWVKREICLSLERLRHACWIRGMAWKREILMAQGEASGMLRCRILPKEVKEARTERGRCWQGEGCRHLAFGTWQSSLSWGPGRP